MKEIPGATCESALHMFLYCTRQLGIAPEDLLEGTDFDLDYLQDPRLWISAYGDMRMDRNIFLKSPRKLTHYDFYGFGRDFRFSPHSSLNTLYSLIPAGRVLKEISRVISHFNNYFTMENLMHSHDESHMVIRYSPFFIEHNSGSICRYTEGVLAANFDLHHIHQYRIQHHLCAADLGSVIRNSLVRYDLRFEQRRGIGYVDGEAVAERIALEPELLAGGMVFSGPRSKADPYGDAWRITRDLVREDRVILRKGDVYNAPFCYLQANWQSRSPFVQLHQRFRNLFLSPRIIRDLRTSIENANQGFFEAKEALDDSERKSQILKVYTRKSLLEKLENGVDPREIRPARENRAVMFMDIRDFTYLSENMDARDVVRFLNSFFARMNRHIDRHGGEIDKLMGDCILASFADADEAVNAATSMLSALQEYNRERLSYKHDKIHTGTGISYGQVVVGNIGSDTKLDYTLVGDTVNSADRIQELCKEYKAGFLISGSLYDQLRNRDEIRYVDEVRLRGRQGLQRVYEVFRHEPPEVRELKQIHSGQFEEANRLYYKGSYREALDLYGDLVRRFGAHRYLRGYSADPISDVMMLRCERALSVKA